MKTTYQSKDKQLHCYVNFVLMSCITRGMIYIKPWAHVLTCVCYQFLYNCIFLVGFHNYGHMLYYILVTSNVLDHVSLLLCSVIAQTYHGRLMYLMKGTSEARRAYLTIYIHFYYTCFMHYLGYCAGLCIVVSNTYCVFVSPFYVLCTKCWQFL